MLIPKKYQEKKMKIIDVDKENKDTYLVCFEEWSEGMMQARPIKDKWFKEMKEKGLRVKLALSNDGVVGGMIEYMPIEESYADGKDLYFVNCIWVHGHPVKGIGNMQGKGMGVALLKAAEDDVKSLGKKGLVAWGLSEEYWMTASWYEKHGYKRVDQEGMMALVWKPFAPDAVPPKWIRGKFVQEPVPGKVKITAFYHGQCPTQNTVYMNAKRVAEEFGDKVVFEEINMNIAANRRKYGLHIDLCINGKIDFLGPPASYEQIREKVQERIREINNPT